MNTISKEWTEFLKTAYGNKNITTRVTVKSTKIFNDEVITIPLNKLFDMYGNLILNGFTEEEALTIVAKVASSAIRTE